IAVFIRFERISDPRVREYYETMTENMVARLYLVKRNVSSMDEFEKVQRIYKVTHLFVGEEEYEEEKDRLEALDNSISVFVVADEGFALPLKSRARILRKPFYSFTLAGVLNADSSDEADDHSGKRMVTPGVSALVVDDEAMNLMVAEGIFKDYGMKVKTVFSGFEAIKACENEHFDIIFLDHMMPEMDGVETLKHLRNLEKSKGELSAMVALTANAVSGAKEMFLSEGFDGFVAKPIEYSELERVLRKVLPRSSVDYIEGDIIFDENTESSVISGKEADPFEAMRSKGINTADGIRYCRNDKEFYMDILKSFVSDSASKQDGIITALENGDIESYRIQVHALKSTSKMIGAASLSDFARQMEDAAKKKDVPYIQSHQDDLMNMYDNVLDIITGSIGFKSDNGKKELLDIERDELLSKLTELKATISTYEQEKADSIIEELSGYRLGDTVLSEALSNIRSSIDDFDMQSALSETEGLIEDIGGAAK
ncbi:MAG: response regulator, partial [Lachnospiraceae bacterium]|nr:response regulator [Lachnospiraceae bacterium]